MTCRNQMRITTLNLFPSLVQHKNKLTQRITFAQPITSFVIKCTNPQTWSDTVRDFAPQVLTLICRSGFGDTLTGGID